MPVLNEIDESTPRSHRLVASAHFNQIQRWGSIQDPAHSDEEDTQNPFEDVLAITGYHVRRATSQILATQPWCLIEVLRCRQWASTPFTLQRLNPSEAVVSAYAFLVARLQHTVFHHNTGDLALTDCTRALQSLQSALSHSRSRQQVDLIPAAWLLTLSEMLDFPSSKVWHTHAAGTMALIKTELCSHEKVDKGSLSRMMPSLLEAFLTSEAVLTSNEPWQAIVQPVVAGSLDDDAEFVEYIASSLVTVLALIAESGARMTHNFTNLLDMMDRANKARYSLKNIVIELVDLGLGDSDVLGLCLAALLGLDRLISRLRHEAFAHDLDSSYEEDDTRLCVQILQEEFKRSEATPATDIQLAFKRHAPMLAPRS
ncbi:hypothetical protein LTR78_004029 [Recurvomyces mirabilis]|uniref:Uncharacterized protein n=2 Tax=Recurvomyces mirabilis TaxID=574656 RepID=A0AAE0WRF8_9PEZI|nr:hypothetical protein LTR78_004029 [Recurvomyces mirabilis]